MIPEKEEDKEELGEVDMAEWLITYLGTHYMDAFMKALNSLEFPTKKKEDGSS